MSAKYLKFHGNDLEDQAIYENFNLPKKGVFIDVGAGPDGIQGSNSYFFEKNGWKCVVIDADPRNFKALKKNRKCVYNVAISSNDGVGKIQTQESPDLTVLSETGNVNVPTARLETILDMEKIDKIDILSIDTEGTELEVWESFDFQKIRPAIVIVEAVSDRVVNENIPKYFSEIGYTYVATRGPNLIYTWEEKPVQTRDPKTIVYGSSYDRGLEHLLKMWPEVIKEVPDAKLRIFYGWILFDKMLSGNPASMAWKAKMQELMKQPGITELGRISHGACEVEFKNAGIWAYPTHFGEISCITGMRAQALGAVPVVINYAALQTTVQHGIKVEGDIYEPEVREEFKKQLIALLKDEKRQEEIRVPMMQWAKETFPWSKVALQWSEEFKSDKSLDDQVNELMENNQALDAWNLVKDTDYPKKDRVYLKVRHAFEPEEYTKFYSEHLPETPVPEELALDCTKLAPRFKWVVEQIEKQKPKTIQDLGCADGYLCLTLAKRGYQCYGVNLYKPSVDLANERAKKNNLPAKFLCFDFRDPSDRSDAVVLFEVLEHLPDPELAIKICMSKVEQGGSLYISTPSPDHLGIQIHKDEPNHGTWDDGKPSGHLKLYNEAELREMLKGYKIKQMFLDEEKCWLIEVTK